MKRMYLSVVVASLLSFGLAACGDDDEENNENRLSIETPEKPQDDGVITLEGSGAQKLYKLLTRTNPTVQCMSRNSLNITDEQWKEIADFTKELTEGSANATNKYKRIFNWVSEHIKYDHQGGHSQDPYAVFISKTAICQGFSNLMKVMLLTQDIPAILVNGWLRSTDGAHAWVYCYADGKWIVSDPTNKNHYMNAKKVADYEMLLDPVMAEVEFEQDGFVCNFNGANFNLMAIKTAATSVTIPDEVCHITINAFIPEKELPALVSELNLGNNVITLGSREEGNIRLKDAGKNLKNVLVGTNNIALETYGGAVYQKLDDSNMPYFVPPMVEELHLKPLKKMEKGTVEGLINLKRLYVAKGLESIDSFAVEHCESLEEIHLPASFDISTMPKDAFVVPEGCKIIRD